MLTTHLEVLVQQVTTTTCSTTAAADTKMSLYLRTPWCYINTALLFYYYYATVHIKYYFKFYIKLNIRKSNKLKNSL